MGAERTARARPHQDVDSLHIASQCRSALRALIAPQRGANRPPFGLAAQPCALRLRRPARRLWRLHGVGRAAPGPPVASPLARPERPRRHPPAGRSGGRRKRVFQTMGSGPGGQLDAKRLVHGRSEAEPVDKGRRLQLSTRFASGARKPPATPQGSCPRSRALSAHSREHINRPDFWEFRP